MSDQDSMTHEQLEAAGYVFDLHHVNSSYWLRVLAPDGWEYHSANHKLVDGKATAHHRQQQELARLRELASNVLNYLYRKVDDLPYPQDFMQQVYTDDERLKMYDYMGSLLNTLRMLDDTKTERAE